MSSPAPAITVESLEKDRSELTAEISRAAVEVRLAEAKRDKLSGSLAYVERLLRQLKEPPPAALAPAPASATKP